MRKRILWLLFLFFGLSVPVQAADLETTIRLESQKIGANPLPVLILIKTKTLAVENQININVANGWTISSNVNVSTSGLPTGVTPLPGIANGNGTGQIINFSCGDLLADTLYGFYITSGISINPSIGNKTWIVSTNTDTIKVNVPIVSSDQVVVTGKVGALASDFQIGISADKNSDLNIDDVVTYEITYGSYLPTVTKPLIISGNWSRGTVVGSPTPSVDILDYVIGSGSVGYGGVNPIIDLINNRIYWTINTFPANTFNQKVSFKLKVNHQYSGQSKVSFVINSQLSGANVVTTNSSLINYYQPYVAPTSTPTPGPAPTLIGSTLINPTPTISKKINIQIDNIKIENLSDTNSGIFIETNVGAELIKISYGTSNSNLNKTVTWLKSDGKSKINLDGLSPDTIYYFRIEASEGESKTLSDIYVFKTASTGEGVNVDEKTLILTVDNNVILDASTQQNGLNSVVILSSQDYALKLSFNKPELIKSVQAYLKNPQVLGINTIYAAEPNSISVDLDEIHNGSFVGHLISPKENGYYEIIVRVTDINGAISEKNIGIMRVISPLTIVDSDFRPLEDVKVIFEKFNERNKVYELIPSSSLGINNPSYTELDGTLRVPLTKGLYRLSISNFGYEGRTIIFDIGMGENEKMPRVVLKRTRESLIGMLGFYKLVTTDVHGYTVEYFNFLTSSTRFYKLVSLTVAFTTLFLIGVFMVEKYKITWILLPKKIVSLILRKSPTGTVTDHLTDFPIKNASIYLMDGKISDVIYKTESDSLGNFYFEKIENKNYRLAVVKDGYEPSPMMDFSAEGINMKNIVIKLEKVFDKSHKFQFWTGKLAEVNRRVFLSFWLTLLLFLEILFWKNFGIKYTWWWLLVSIINILVWTKVVIMFNRANWKIN